jgi:hypothetical protein
MIALQEVRVIREIPALGSVVIIYRGIGVILLLKRS